jgi:hypothetical protein
MNRKPLLVALGAAALASVLFATVSLAATGSKATAGTTMHLIEHDVSFNFVPAAPGPRKGDNAKPGDVATFTNYLTTTKGQRVGHTYATCTATTGGSNPALQCTGTFKLPGGTLIGSALIDTTGDAPQRIAILGGTGAYEGARGSILSVSKSQNTSVDTFHLLP